MRIAYMTTDEVNQALAAQLAGGVRRSRSAAASRKIHRRTACSTPSSTTWMMCRETGTI